MDFISNNSMLLSQKTLDYLWQKQTVVMDNIANAETPGFKGKYVTFEEEFSKKMSSMQGATKSSIRDGILDSKIRLRNTNNENTKLDGNNVDVDVESAKLAETTIHYQYMLKSFNDNYTRLRTVIRGQ